MISEHGCAFWRTPDCPLVATKKLREDLLELAGRFRLLDGYDRSGFAALMRQALALGVDRRRIVGKLGVSLPALSRWIHEDSVPLKLPPHKQQQQFLQKRLEYNSGMGELLETIAREMA